MTRVGPSFFDRNRSLSFIRLWDISLRGQHAWWPAGLGDRTRLHSADAFNVSDLAGSPKVTVSGKDLQETSSYHRQPIGTFLQRYGRNLTREAELGLIDPVLGRDTVIHRALQVLLRRRKNNPILIGDPGVGKTAIVEGLAQITASSSAPFALKGKSIIALDLGSLVSGTQYRGAFEERLQGLLHDIQAGQGQIILFIDEIHMLMDAGRVEGGMNAANLLKPALARGELRCIGATTFEEYRKHVEVDAAFARRLQPILVEEPTREEAIIWLGGLATHFGSHHGVVYPAETIETAVDAAQRYISDRKLPDSAIDLLDEAAARVQLRQVTLQSIGIQEVIDTENECAHAKAVDGDRDVIALDNSSHGIKDGNPKPNVQPSLRPSSLPLHLSLAQSSRSPNEVMDLLEWFGAAPEQPLPGFAGHRQTTEARRQRYLQQTGQGGGGTVSNPDSSTDADGMRQRGYGGGGLPCPHCGTLTLPVAPGQQHPPSTHVTVTCPSCNFRFLGIPPEKLILGASLFLKDQNKKTAISAAADAPSVKVDDEEDKVADLDDLALEYPEVKPQDVLEVVATMAGIPLSQVLSARSPLRYSMQYIKESLNASIVGQREAVDRVAAAVQLGMALRKGQPQKDTKTRRPITSLALWGPPETGKAMLASTLSNILFATDRALVRFDLAQSSEKTAVSGLIGAPPGFVGYGEGGALTEALRRRPHSVVLLENIHRAHPDVLALIGQILEMGQLQDSMGRWANFQNTVVILTLPFHPTTRGPLTALTSNDDAIRTQPASSTNNEPRAAAASSSSQTYTSADQASHARVGGLSMYGDLLARVDDIIEFKGLQKESMIEIAHNILNEVRPILDTQGITFMVEEEAMDEVVQRVVEQGQGVPGLRGAIRSCILSPLVEAALNTQREEGQGVVNVLIQMNQGTRKISISTTSSVPCPG
jgi:ATP-dependent Clp protease ATP-binding subunit ClpA